MSDKNIEENQAQDPNTQEVSESQDVSLELAAVEQRPVTVKKGSFLSSLSFLLSLAALLIAAYLFYLQQNQQAKQALSPEIEKQIKQQITNITQQQSTQIQALKKQISSLEQANTSYQQKMADLKQALANSAENQASSANNTGQNYDDSKVLAKIRKLENKISQGVIASISPILEPKFSAIKEQLDTQQSQIMQLSKEVGTELDTQKQSIALLNTEIKAKKNSSGNVVALNTTKYPLEVAQTYLKVAALQLNTNGNVKKAKELIGKTQKELQSSKNAQAKALAQELKTVISQLQAVKTPDLNKITNTINSIAQSAELLEFPAAGQPAKSKEDAAWYDKLVVVRKIDANEQTALSNGDQYAIMQTIQSHFEMLKVALMSQNQALFHAKIDKIDALLAQYFKDKAKNVRNKLTQLKGIELNPALPDLSPYLQKIQNLVISS